MGLGAEVGKAAAPQVAVGLPGSPWSSRRQVEASQPFPSPWAGPQLFLWLTQGLSRGRWRYMFIGGRLGGHGCVMCWSWHLTCARRYLAPLGICPPLRDKPTPKLVRGSRGEVGRVLGCGPRRGPGCASHHGIQRDRGLGVTQLGKPEVEKKAARCFGSASGEAAALG